MMIEVDGLTKKFEKEGEAVLDGLSFCLNAGDSLAVIGPSGCGKTTLLAIMAGLIPPSAGSVRIHGDNSRPGKTSMILQDYGLFPWKTLAENVALGMKIQNMPAEVRAAKTGMLLCGAGSDPLCPSLSGSVERRAKAAGRHCQSHCHRAGHSFDGRAVFVPGCHHPRTSADRHEGHVAEKQIDFCHRYPQC